LARKRSPWTITVTERVSSGLSTTLLRRWTREAILKLHPPSGSIGLAVVGEAESRRWNKQYRGKDKATNVLTFPARGQEGECGDILLCPAIIRREARTLRRPYSDYFRFLLQHGCIHLLGLDHQTPTEQRRWEKLEHLLQ